jgi:hypothetical protein
MTDDAGFHSPAAVSGALTITRHILCMAALGGLS